MTRKISFSPNLQKAETEGTRTASRTIDEFSNRKKPRPAQVHVPLPDPPTTNSGYQTHWQNIVQGSSRRKPIVFRDDTSYYDREMPPKLKTGDAKRSEVLEAARMIIGRASPEDRALIAGMALPGHEDVFEAITLAEKEFADRRADFSKPALPILSAKQITAMGKRAKEWPW